MAKRRRRRRRRRRESTDRDLSRGSIGTKASSSSEALHNTTEAGNEAQTLSEEESPATASRFGFDGICDECKNLYLSKMRSISSDMRAEGAMESGIRVAGLDHIDTHRPCETLGALFSPDEPSASCAMCRTFLSMRCPGSSGRRDHLYAFSAAKLYYGRSWITRSMGRGGTEPGMKEAVFFCVLPDIPRPITAWTTALKSGCFLAANTCEYPKKRLSGELCHDYQRSDTWNAGSTPELKTRRTTPLPYAMRSKTVDFLSAHLSEDGDSLGVESLDSDTFYGCRIDPTTVNYSLLRGWLRQCHKRCQLENFIKEQKRFQKIPFYLLDCLKREVFKVPARRQQRYVALSYVWGNINSASRPRPRMESSPFQLSSHCANVVEDAIAVTSRLGYRYLWVDSLCTSPHSAIRHEQIANMDVVYKNADLTIIAAAGTNADYGLPGVGARTRHPQPQISIGNHQFVSVTINPAKSLEESTYQTRGWTYQEYFYSRRRLIFTDQQVYFECRDKCMARQQQETLVCPSSHFWGGAAGLDCLQDASMQDAYFRKLPVEWKYVNSAAVTSHVLSSGKIFALYVYEHHVNEFSRRKLSYAADSLQALSSVLDRFMYETHAICHLHGLPFMPRQNSTYSQGLDKHAFHFKYGLLWTHGQDVTPKARRGDFPSWSWTGWEGRVQWLASTTNLRWFAEAADSVAKFEFPMTIAPSSPAPANDMKSRKTRLKLCPVDSWRPNNKNHGLPKELLFTAVLYSVPFRVGNPVPKWDGNDFGIYLDDKVISRRLHLTQVDFEHETIREGKWRGLILGTALNIQCFHVLVLREVASRGMAYGGRYFERFGVIDIDTQWKGWTAPLIVQGWLV
ncbi:hypothetical protein PG999_008597 [Apiospora kogelbergensis]|uniref:Heterokaryon incompatibility domain-containing protein n=1 Tax=Apiospora kogelbergensis TaxID=1337665 RepID=A0AAW0QKY8_9PEZI